MRISVDQEEGRGFLLADLAGLPLPSPLDARNLGKRVYTHLFDKEKGLAVKLKGIDKQETDGRRGASALKLLAITAKADAARTVLLQKAYAVKVPSGSKWHLPISNKGPSPLERWVSTHADDLLGYYQSSPDRYSKRSPHAWPVDEFQKRRAR